MSNVLRVQPQKNKVEYRGGKENSSGMQTEILQEHKGHQEKRLSHWRKTWKAFLLPIAPLWLYLGGVPSPTCVKSSSWDRWNFCSPLPPGDACFPVRSQSTPWQLSALKRQQQVSAGPRTPKSRRTFPRGSCCSTPWGRATWRGHVPTLLCSEHRERCSRAEPHCLADQGCSQVRWWLRSRMWAPLITAPT